MHERPSSEPDGYTLYQRLLDGEINASADIALAYYDSLCAWLASVSSRLDAHYYLMAVDDALIDLFQRPRTYDPTKGSLLVFLRVAANNRLRNVLRSERRHSDRRAPIDAVEHVALAVKYGQGNIDDDPAEIVERREREEALLAQLPPQHPVSVIPNSITDDLTPAEREVLELHLRKERKTTVFARVMGIADLSPAEQKAQVKRLRDKLDKRLRRAGVNV